MIFKMIFKIEIQKGAIINIDDCSDTAALSAKWEQHIPEQWPQKTTDCHFALKLAITDDQPDNYVKSIVTGGYKYCLSDNTRPATEEYLQEVGQKLTEVYLKWKSLVKVPNVLPDGMYTVIG